MDEKKNAHVTAALLFSIIMIFTVADLLGEDRLFSETENRLLAPKPDFTLEALFAGKYMEDYEAYVTDQFVGRDKWITMKTYMDILLRKKEVGGVYLGKDGYLIEQHLPEGYSPKKEAERISLLQKLVERFDAMVMLVPTADNILRDKMPAHAPYYDQAGLLERIAAEIGEEHCIDVYSALMGHAGEEIYYRTDHHWTSLGAYYGYLAWAQAMGRTDIYFGADEMETVAEDFLGTLHSKVNLDMPGEPMRYFPKTQDYPVQVTYDLRRKSETCYEETYLETKNKYGFFLDDNHALVEIETDNHNGEALFVIKDSYANCLVPLLIPYYERIYVMDLRYFNGRLFPFMEERGDKDDMDVLVLYNCVHFLEEFQYSE